jgi:hypothetical protein
LTSIERSLTAHERFLDRTRAFVLVTRPFGDVIE